MDELNINNEQCFFINWRYNLIFRHNGSFAHTNRFEIFIDEEWVKIEKSSTGKDKPPSYHYNKECLVCPIENVYNKKIIGKETNKRCTTLATSPAIALNHYQKLMNHFGLRTSFSSFEQATNYMNEWSNTRWPGNSIGLPKVIARGVILLRRNENWVTQVKLSQNNCRDFI